MTLEQLIEVMEFGTAFVLNFGPATVKYYCPQELMEETPIYERVKSKPVRNIWHSKNLYNAIVIDLD